AQVLSRGIRRVLGRLERNGKGLLPALSHELASQHDLLSRASHDLLIQRLVPALGDARRATDAMFARFYTLLESGPSPLRLDSEFGSSPVWGQGLTAELDGALAAFRR